jgi:hypothetical protein
MKSRSFKIISVIKSRTLRRIGHAMKCKTQEIIKKFWFEYFKEKTTETTQVTFIQMTE